MPTFDFQCRDCNHTFEFSRPFGSSKHPPCAKCSSKNTEKLIAPPSIQFKGEGFYKTDASTLQKKKDKQEPEKKESKDSKEAKDE